MAMLKDVREIFAADCDKELIAPLTSWFPNSITVGASNSLAFSSQLDVIAPGTVYDKIDYKLREDMTGEELYTETRDSIGGGFKGGQQYWKWQVSLMQDYSALINPPEAEG